MERDDERPHKLVESHKGFTRAPHPCARALGGVRAVQPWPAFHAPGPATATVSRTPPTGADETAQRTGSTYSIRPWTPGGWFPRGGPVLRTVRLPPQADPSVAARAGYSSTTAPRTPKSCPSSSSASPSTSPGNDRTATARRSSTGFRSGDTNPAILPGPRLQQLRACEVAASHPGHGLQARLRLPGGPTRQTRR